MSRLDRDEALKRVEEIYRPAPEHALACAGFEISLPLLGAHALSHQRPSPEADKTLR